VEGAILIAGTRKSEKRSELLALGAAHVIATKEEELVTKVKEITVGKGAHHFRSGGQTGAGEAGGSGGIRGNHFRVRRAIHAADAFSNNDERGCPSINDTRLRADGDPAES
jgi:hypothetical protein